MKKDIFVRQKGYVYNERGNSKAPLAGKMGTGSFKIFPLCMSVNYLQSIIAMNFVVLQQIHFTNKL